MRSLWLNICVLVVVQQAVFSDAFDRFQHFGSHGHHGHPGGMLKKCCKVEPTAEDTQHMEAVKKFFEECRQELGEPEGGKHKGGFACMAECVSKKTKVLNEDGTLNEDAAKKHIIDDSATQEHLKAIAADTATKCIEAAKAAEPAESGCSKIPMKLMGCVMKDFFNACPADMQDQSEHCAKIREKINSGQMENPDDSA